MRSATSCFNATLYCKTMFRAWPLWALYTLMWLFLIPLSMLSRYLDMNRWDSVDSARDWLQNLAYDLPNYLTTGVMISCVYGVLCAMAVFGYLYSSRSACMMHSLPLRREGLFATQYLAGLSFGLLPHLGAALLTLIIEAALLPGEGLLRVLPSLGIWLAAQSATFLFFFSFAVFCAMFTGHILALPAFYAILNALVMVVWSLFNELMSLFFYGYAYRSMPGLVLLCTPVAKLTEACGWNMGQVTAGDSAITTGDWYLNSPATVAAYAAAGLVLALLALLVYRYRHVESAGDVVAIALVRPVFKYGVALCSGLCIGTWTVAFFGWYEPLPLSVSVLLWAAAGYFVAEMLLKKSFRVLRAWKGCAVTVALLALVCAGCFLDVFGVVTRVPDPGEVASVRVTGSLGYPNDSGSVRSGVTITQPEQIGEITALHQAIVEKQEEHDYSSPSYRWGFDTISLEVTYTLKSGSTLSREYYSVPIFEEELEQEGTVSWCAARLNADRDFVAACYNFDYFEQGRLVEAYLDEVYQWVPDGSGGRSWESSIQYLDGAAGEDLAALWQAVRADFADGSIGVHAPFDRQELRGSNLVFCFEMPASSTERAASTSLREVSITVQDSASRTLDWLRTFSNLGTRYELISHEGSSGGQDVPATEQLPADSPAGEAAPAADPDSL